MANNQNVNKVVYDGNTLIDITDTTAVEEDVDTGKVFYKASGARSVGTGSSGSGKMDLVTNPTAGNVLITDANGQAQDAGVEPIYYETVASGVDAVLVGIDMDLLWTNANPTSAFAAQTMSIDLSDYKMVLIMFTCISTYYFNGLFYINGDTNYAFYVTANNSVCRSRTVAASSGGIVFGDGKGNDTTSNTDVVPYKIYGIR